VDGLTYPAGGSVDERSPLRRRTRATVTAVRRTEIVATIGPACRDPETLARMVEAGMDVARLNFSHGSREEHADNVQRVREAANRAGRQVAILQDLPGPKLRIGPVTDDLIDLRPGSTLTLACGSDEVGRSDLRRPAQGSDLWPARAKLLAYLGRVISNTMNFSVGVAATISCGTFSGMSRKSPGPTR